MMYKIGAVIVAAGAGLRFGERKQFKVLGKRPLLYHSLHPFIKSDLIAEIVVVVPVDSVSLVKREIRSITHTKPMKVVAGGDRRQDSVFAGVSALSDDCTLVCIHDAVRPFVTERMIADCIEACRGNDGAIIAIRAKDTIKQVDPSGRQIQRTLDRSLIWQAQTPQTFNRGKLLKAVKQAEREGSTGTDEAALMERLGHSVVVVEGSSTNIKITSPADWIFAETIIKNHN